MFGTLGHILRLARAGFVLAREGVFAKVDPFIVPPAAQAPLALARLIARRDVTQGALATAIARLGPSYVKLGQFLATRADIVGPAAVRRSRNAAGPHGPFSARRRDRHGGSGPRQADRGDFQRIRRTGGGGFDRAGPSRTGPRRGRRTRRRGQGAAARRSSDSSGVIWRTCILLPVSPNASSPRRAACKLVEVVDTLARTVRMEMDFRLEAAAASRIRRKCRRRCRSSASRRSIGTARRRKC